MLPVYKVGEISDETCEKVIMSCILYSSFQDGVK